MKIIKYLPHVQAIYYIITGVWPLIHMESFLFITGPKIDLWLVEVVGYLILVIGIALLIASIKNSIGTSIIFLGIASAAGLGLIEFYYSYIDRIWNIYMADTVVEILIITGWILYIIYIKKGTVKTEK